jgi:hypothetical protein
MQACNIFSCNSIHIYSTNTKNYSALLSPLSLSLSHTHTHTHIHTDRRKVTFKFNLLKEYCRQYRIVHNCIFGITRERANSCFHFCVFRPIEFIWMQKSNAYTDEYGLDS